ncbi:MAG: hypothetical protein Q4E33_05225 [Erysipelotrichaceae bacterium]|nr:hypothetical protein [Erysipelotrichaceae bacterium]
MDEKRKELLENELNKIAGGNGDFTHTGIIDLKAAGANFIENQLYQIDCYSVCCGGNTESQEFIGVSQIGENEFVNCFICHGCGNTNVYLKATGELIK